MSFINGEIRILCEVPKYIIIDPHEVTFTFVKIHISGEHINTSPLRLIGHESVDDLKKQYEALAEAFDKPILQWHTELK